MSNKQLKKGDTAPKFCLPNQDEEEVCLEDYEGKWIILYFYPKDNTPGCTLEGINFTEELDFFKDLDADVLGVSPDSPDTHRKFKQLKEIEVTLLSDQEHDVLEDYGVWKKKKMFGNEYMGVVRSTFLIRPDGKIAEIWRNVKVEGHVEDVKKKLKDLKS